MTPKPRKRVVRSLAAAAVDQMRDWEAKEHDRIIKEVKTPIDRLVRDFKEFRHTSGGTLDRLGPVLDHLVEKFEAFEKRAGEFEAKTDKRLERVERAVGLLDPPR